MATEDELRTQLAKLGSELDRRAKQARLLDQYVESGRALPDMVVRAKVTKAYQLLAPMAEVPWGSLIVDSVLDRLIPTGIRSGDERIDDALWTVWQDNAMDAESLLAHENALTHGRAFALVWPATRGRLRGRPQITLDSAEQMIVQYAEGSRYERVAAMRRWVDDNGRRYATLYRPDGVYKFQEPRSRLTGLAGRRFGEWERRDVDGETWPLPNPWGIVPAVELPVNRKLKPGAFPYARGEFEHVLGLLDRINTLSFLGLVVAFWQGFPIRVLIGDKILRDDDGNPLPPFEAMADSVAQFEDPETKLAEFKATDRRNLSVFEDLDQLASVTKTPRHAFPINGGISNISADTLRAAEGGLISKVPRHKGSLGEGWEGMLHIAGLMLDEPVELPPGAEMQWSDHENRSMAERADAATKLKDLLPWQAIAEKYLNATADEISRWQADRAVDPLTQLVGDLARTPATPPPAAAAVAEGVTA